MGAAISALDDSLTTLKAQPQMILLTFVLGFISMIIALIGGMISMFLPGVGNLITAPVTAALFAGLLGVTVVVSRDSDTSVFSQYETELSNSGVDVFIACLLKNLVYFGIGLLFAAVIVAGVFATGASSTEGAASGVFLLALLVGLVVTVLYLTVAFFLQFINAVIVIDGEDPLESFKASFTVVRNNLWSVTGYTLLRYGVATALWIPAGLVVVLTFWLVGELAGALVILAAFLFVSPVIATWFYVYHAQYYVRLRPVDAAGEPERLN